jgi:hypothetical protein
VQDFLSGTLRPFPVPWRTQALRRMLHGRTVPTPTPATAGWSLGLGGACTGQVVGRGSLADLDVLGGRAEPHFLLVT